MVALAAQDPRAALVSELKEVTANREGFYPAISLVLFRHTSNMTVYWQAMNSLDVAEHYLHASTRSRSRIVPIVLEAASRSATEIALKIGFGYADSPRLRPPYERTTSVVLSIGMQGKIIGSKVCLEKED